MTRRTFGHGVRKAAWGAVSLGVWALSFGSPIREVPLLHQVLGIALLVGYLLVSLDPPEPSKRQRDLLIAGIVCSIASFLIVVVGSAPPFIVVARILAVAVAALPLWLAAGPARYGFVAAGALAAVTIVQALEAVGGYATSLHAYVAALSAFAVAVMLHKPHFLARGDRKPPRMVVASNIVTLTPEEKAAALARIERRWRDGEIPEHKYWDLRQELESR